MIKFEVEDKDTHKYDDSIMTFTAPLDAVYKVKLKSGECYTIKRKAGEQIEVDKNNIISILKTKSL